jgi:hypothetical protein
MNRKTVMALAALGAFALIGIVAQPLSAQC